jgi:pimeloyl-ACP methyl ester carboxylesterase
MALVGSAARAEPVPAAFYEKPTALVALPDGRKLAFACMGQGSPTVVLSAGAGDWSNTWAKVQGEMAKTTRVCAWDRPGFGHSDASPTMDSGHLVKDLADGLAAAGIHGPYVMVGHSLGGYETRLFTDLHRGEVVGMVLVDASYEHQVGPLGAASPSMKKQQDTQTAALRACLEAKTRGELTPGSIAAGRCVGVPGAPFLDLIDAMEPLSSDQLDKARISYGALPLVVLTHGGSLLPPGTPAEEIAATDKLWLEMQNRQAALSTASEHQVVEGASHYIQRDKPQVVIDAVNGVVAKARAATPRR